MVAFMLSMVLISSTSVIALPAGNITGPNRINLGFEANLGKQINISARTDGVQQLGYISALLPERSKGREYADLSLPTPLQQKDSLYDYTQQFVASLFHRKPIIDTISEHEKYGNTGDQFRPLGNAIVNGYEGFSNLLNAATSFPFEKMKEVTRQLSAYFSSVGAKLVGL